jgi:coproporphyrinogen III oxidase-like Fe-S oxidoreductase
VITIVRKPTVENFKVNLFVDLIESLFRTAISARTTEPVVLSQYDNIPFCINHCNFLR